MTALRERVAAIPSWQIALGGALLALGFLVAAQLRSEGPRVRYTTQERSPLIETVLELQRQQEALKAGILELRTEIERTAEAGRGSSALVRDLNGRLDEARAAAGLTAVVGSGIVFQLDDAATTTRTDDAGYRVTAHDLRALVEELWLAGATAMSINGERFTGSSAVVDVGGSVLVNGAYLAPPYQITAVGPSDLYDRLAASQGYRDFVDARVGAYGIDAAFGEFDRVEVPAFAGRIALDYAQAEASPEAAEGSP